MANTIELRVRTVVWAATAAVLAVAATLMITSAWNADAAPGDADSTYVPTAGCRLFDYRPAPDQVGDRSAPLAAGEVHTQQVTGNVGNCTGPLAIPSDAVAVAMNVTIANPTAQSNLRLFPADLTDVPTLSNLNFSAGQAPFPNKVDVALSPAGAIKLFNQNGSVAVLADVVGYYTKASLAEIQTRLLALENGAMPIAVNDDFVGNETLTMSYEPLVDVELTAPVDGTVTLNSMTNAFHNTAGSDVGCVIARSTDADPVAIGTNLAGVHIFESEGPSANDGTISSTRAFDVAAGSTTTFEVRCRASAGAGEGRVFQSILTGVFTPAP
ncbi:MAG: hypothetical protein AAGA42_06510 [Actinomycetota bacterium]